MQQAAERKALERIAMGQAVAHFRQGWPMNSGVIFTGLAQPPYHCPATNQRARKVSVGDVAVSDQIIEQSRKGRGLHLAGGRDLGWLLRLGQQRGHLAAELVVERQFQRGEGRELGGHDDVTVGLSSF